MSPTLKRIAITLATLMLLAVVGVIALMLWVIQGENRAKENATALCASATEGASVANLLERAIAFGANPSSRWRSVEAGDEQLLAVYPGRLPRSGYVCLVTARDGRVLSAEVSAAD